jgi:hypothetical protein
MTIPENVRQFAVENRELFDKIDQWCLEIESRKEECITLSSKNPIDRIIWKLKTYEQFSIYRVADLTATIFQCWQYRRQAASFILKRAVLESAATLYDMVERLKPFISEGKIEDIDFLIMNVLFSNRVDKDSPFHAFNILTSLDHLEKTFPGIRRIYDYSSEYAHPNSDALLGLYGVVDTDSSSCRIEPDKSFTKDNISLFFGGLETNLSIFIIALDELKTLYTALKDIAGMRQDGETS